MILAVDIGNTHTVLGLYTKDKLVKTWRISTVAQATKDEVGVLIRSLFDLEALALSEVVGVSLASVVPALTQAWCEAVQAYFSCSAQVVGSEDAADLFGGSFERPQEMGADRIADALAAKERYECPCIVVDFGTATNIEVIDAQGAFVGGLIAPGLETSAQALVSRAAKLSSVALDEPKRVIGRTTQEALVSGLVFGEVERVDGLVRRIKEELGMDAQVVATGGLAMRVAPLSSEIDVVDSHLTLDGLKIMYDRRQATQANFNNH